MRKSILMAATIALSLAASAGTPKAAPVAYVFDQKRAEVTFSYSLPFSSGRGHFSSVGGMAHIDDAAPANTRVEALIDTRTLRAGNSLSQSELRGTSFFNVAKFPQMRFKSRSVRAKNATTSDVSGDLTVRGVTQPVVLHVTLQPPGTSGRRDMRATTRINRSDFGMTAYPFFVGDTVDIEIRAVLRPAH